MKKGLLVYVQANESWIGGVYYEKNMAYQLSQSTYITNKYNIYVLINDNYEKIFDCLPSNVKVIKKKKKINIWEKICLMMKLKVLNIQYVFPYRLMDSDILFKTIDWIPDFQHKHFPEFFTKEEVDKRDEKIQKILLNSEALVLSSNDALEDVKKYYKFRKNNIYIVPFVSYIKEEIIKLTYKDEISTLEKFGLSGKKYICVSNQFWKHKNHIVVLKAIDWLKKENEEVDITFVFTGKLEDKRNPDYIEELKDYFDDVRFNGILRNLGFLERKEQLVIIKNSEFVIQPSLFEGWGTVLEDCKVLDKTVILSDISIHREQKNDKCILFNPKDHIELGKIIAEEINKTHVSNINFGVEDMEKRAKIYISGFEDCLKSSITHFK